MIIDFGDSYKLECSVVEGEPSIKLVGSYTTVNTSYDGRNPRTYINFGSLAFKMLDLKSNIVIMSSSVFRSGDEVLVSFNCEVGTVVIYFDLVSCEVAYEIK